MSLIEVSMTAGTVVPREAFENASFQIVLEGGYREPSAESERARLSVHFHPSGDVQDACVDRNSRVFGICIPASRLKLAEGLRCPTEPGDLTRRPIVECMLRLYEEFRRDDSASNLAIEGLSFELLAYSSRDSLEQAIPPAWLRRAHQKVNEEKKTNLSLAVIARDCGVHPSHLARQFRKFYGISLGDHLRNVKFQAAVWLLRTTDMPLDQIAARAGFHDASHLSRAVKQRTGMSPGTYRIAQIRTR